MASAANRLAGGDVEIVAGVDSDDPLLDAYREVEGVQLVVGARRSLSGWTNELADSLLGRSVPTHLASLGDDHLPRTPRFDEILVEAVESFDGPGFSYGNDLIQGRNLPTAWVVSAEIVRALGWMMLPGCQHMYVDNAILALGQAAGRIAYRPEVIVEHLHPLAGKASWDDSYRESNTAARYAADRGAFVNWRQTQLGQDASTVSALTFAPAAQSA